MSVQLGNGRIRKTVERVCGNCEEPFPTRADRPLTYCSTRCSGLATNGKIPSLHPELKRQAHNKVKRAKQQGLLEIQPCVVCGNIQVEAHHKDYAQALEVVWLCDLHHMAAHKI